MSIQNSNNLYTSNTIVVDVGGTTPFTTIASGITAAQALGADTTIFVRIGTYVENLTLVEGINILGENKESTVITGTHVVPTTGAISLSNLTLEATGTDSILGGSVAGTCDIDIDSCIFDITSGMIFNFAAQGTGSLTINNCTDISTLNSIASTTASNGPLSITNSLIGVGPTIALFQSDTEIFNCGIGCPMWSSAGNLIIINSNITGYLEVSGTGVLDISNSSIDSDTNAAISVNSTATVSNVVIDSSAAFPITGIGTCTIGEVTFLTNTAIGVTTPVYTTQVSTGTLKARSSITSALGNITAITGNIVATLGDVVVTDGKLTMQGADGTDGQVLLGNTATSKPAWASITAGAGISLTPGANSLAITNTGSGTTMAWSVITTDTGLLNLQGYINKNGTPANETLCLLPAVAAVGEIYGIQGYTSGGWKITQNAGQSIRLGTSVSTVGVSGYVEFTNQYDSCVLICVTANTEFAIIQAVGNLTVH